FSQQPGPYTGPVWILVAELVFGGLVAIGRGHVCGLVAGRAELKHAFVLAALIDGPGLASAAFAAGLKPPWSSLAKPLVGALGVIAGAKLRHRHREREALER